MTKHAVLSADELNAFFSRVFPEIDEQLGENAVVIETATYDTVTVRFKTQPQHLRPGGTISGPSIFTLCDLAFYAAVNARYGETAQAVTTSLTLNFLRRATLQDLLAEATILKAGRQLVVGDCHVYTADTRDRIAHATMTYALPPDTVS